MTHLKCPFCGYIWKPRRPNPASCPRCKRYQRDEMEFSEVEGPAELPQVNESGKPPGGSKNSYYMCYGCPPDYKERAVMEVNGHNYCYKHAMEAIQELIDDEAN